jgi:hypothetical protein
MVEVHPLPDIDVPINEADAALLADAVARHRTETTGLPERCGAQPSKRSTARCEMPLGHDGWHYGRTRRGYWKGWA